MKIILTALKDHFSQEKLKEFITTMQALAPYAASSIVYQQMEKDVHAFNKLANNSSLAIFQFVIPAKAGIYLSG